MRPLLDSADAHASFIEAVRLNRIACVRVTASDKVRFEPSTAPPAAGGDYHRLPVFDLTQLERPPLTDEHLTADDPVLMARTREVMHFISQQLGRGILAVPYDDAIYLQDNRSGTPVIWVIHLHRTPDADFLNLLPFRWARKDQVWLLETAVAVPLLYGRGTVGWPDDSFEVQYDTLIRFQHFGDVERRYRGQGEHALGAHEHEVQLRVMAVLESIQRLMTAERGETIVVEGTHEARRINERRDRLGLPRLQPVVRIISLTPRTRWISGLPSEPTGRTVEPHRRRGTIVTNRYGTRFPRRATIVNDPARTRAAPPVAIPTPWYEVHEEFRDGGQPASEGATP